MVSPAISVCLDSVVVKRRGKTVLGPVDLCLQADGFTTVSYTHLTLPTTPYV